MNPQRMGAAAAVAFQAWLLLACGDLGIAPALCLIAAVASLARPFTQPVTRSTWVLLATLLLLSAVALNYMGLGLVSGLRQTWDEWIYPLAPFLLALQTLECLAPASQPLSWRFSGQNWALLAVVYAGSTLPGQIGFALNIAITAAALATCAAVLPQRVRWSAGVATRWCWSAAVLASAGLAAGQASQLFAQWPKFEKWLMTQMLVRANPLRGSRAYVRSGTLSSISQEQQVDPDAVALRVICDQQPGYLRGAAFDTFQHSRWWIASQRSLRSFERVGALRQLDPADSPPDLPAGEAREWFASLAAAGTGPWLQLEIQNDFRRGEVYFTPLQSAYFGQSGAREARVNEWGVVEYGFSTRMPYAAVIGRRTDYAPLESNELTRLQSAPFTHAAVLDQTLARLEGPERTFEQKIARVEGYFRKNHAYSLAGFSTPAGVDPLTHFLTARPAAHCEFFATAAALLLRRHGVPTRYVTGYVVTEQGGESDQWFARNRHAHAWVEAFDVRLNRWVVVEATPGMDAPRMLSPVRAQTDEQAAAQAVDQAGPGSAGWGLRWLAAVSPRIFAWLPWLLALLALGGAAWSRYQARQRQPRTPAEARRLGLQALREQLDRRVRRSGLIREAGETLHQFAQRLEAAAAQGDPLWAAAEWYRLYSAVIYGELALESLPPPPNSVKPDHWVVLPKGEK